MQDWKRVAIAALLAYALALQAVLLSLGGALHGPALAGEQGIVCLEGDPSDPADQAPVQPHDGLCCTLSCQTPSLAGPAPVFASLGLVPVPVAVAGRMPGDAPFLRLTSNVLPVGSRAPPRLG